MTLKWWQRAVVYEIAPISFQDSNGDGKGDLEGLLRRIDYLQWLGIDVVWLTPPYSSPFADFGYDIVDFCAIDPMYGTMDQFDRVVERLHAAGIRLILDFVPNHTSDRHPWFQESRSSRNSPRRDWYFWADAAANGGPPNNWLSRFGGSAWTWDGATGQYYYHAFLEEQPDLNWRNPAVRTAMADVLRFWLRRGVDGFRVDAAAVLIEDDLLRDDPPDPAATEKMPPPQRLKRIFTDDLPETMSCLEELRAVVDEFDDRVLAGEVQGKTERIGHFYFGQKQRLHLPLNFALLDTAWDAPSLQAAIDAYLRSIPEGAWPDWVIGGHDKKRVAEKLGQKRARALAVLLFTLKGTPFFFAGDEIGMEGVEIPTEAVQDPFEKLLPGYGLNRDPERSPMRWDTGANAGFTAGKPWLPMGNDVATRNVAVQRADPRSLLSLYRRLIGLRRRERALTVGEYVPMRSRNDIFAFTRRVDGEEILVLLNMASDPRSWHGVPRSALLLSSAGERADKLLERSVLLQGDEGLVLKRLR
jgi:alpha-glucosidase